MSPIDKIKKSRKKLMSFLVMFTIIVACFSTISFLDKNVKGASTSDFTYYKQLWIQSSQVPGALTNYPLLVYLASDSDLVGYESEDIAFFNATGATQYAHEIEKFDNSTGELIAWVNVTSVASASNTSLYLYYGDADSATEEDVSGTWDSNYIFVGHLDETAGDCIDSTSNGNDGTYVGDLPVQGTGMVGYGQVLDGGDYISMVSGTHVDTTGTIEIWVELDDNTPPTGGDDMIYYDYKDTDNRHKIQSDNNEGTLDSYSKTDGTVNWLLEPASSLDTFWKYLVNAWEATNDAVFWINGSVAATDTSYGADAYDFSVFNIGAHSDGVANQLNGTLDEIRVSNLKRSNNYLETVYNNINNKTTFIQYGINTTNPSSGISLVLNSDTFTHTGELGNTTFSNSSYTYEWAEFNITYDSTPIEYLRINITDINANITSSNCSYQFSSDNAAWGANWTTGGDGGFTITVNASNWLEASGYFGTNPFSTDGDSDSINGIETNTSIWMVEKVTIPSGIGNETYSTTTGTSRTWDAGEYT